MWSCSRWCVTWRHGRDAGYEGARKGLLNCLTTPTQYNSQEILIILRETHTYVFRDKMRQELFLLSLAYGGCLGFPKSQVWVLSMRVICCMTRNYKLELVSKTFNFHLFCRKTFANGYGGRGKEGTSAYLRTRSTPHVHLLVGRLFCLS